MTVALLISSFVTAVANQICQDGKCECAPGFARNIDEECEGKFLHLWLYTNLYNWAVKDFYEIDDFFLTFKKSVCLSR